MYRNDRKLEGLSMTNQPNVSENLAGRYRDTLAPPETCACYVSRLSEEQRLSLHLGAHELSCPVYRESADPVDRMHDAEARFHLSGLGECPWCKVNAAGVGLWNRYPPAHGTE